MSWEDLRLEDSPHIYLFFGIFYSVLGWQPTTELDKENSTPVLKAACGNGWEWGQI